MDINILTVFILAIFVGFEIITKVPPTLHTPLMSGSNAISGIAIVGAIISTKLDGGVGTYLGLKKLGHPRTAPTGNLYGSMGMLVAVIVTIAQMDFGEINNFILIGAGLAIGASIGYLLSLIHI